MTSITLTVTGAKAKAAVSGPLTSGMVGIPVTIKYDDSWEGLTKNLVCRCRGLRADEDEVRTVLNVGETAVVAHEVMQADRYLDLGIEGYTPDGKLVMPTRWAECGKIWPGANADAEPSADPKLSIWNQLQTEINQIKLQAVTEDQLSAAVEGYLEENPIEIPDCSQNGNGLSETASNLLITILRNGVYSSNQSANVTALAAELGVVESNEPDTSEVTLSSISATYSGGEVTVGTAVTDLTGIVVTAHYSDGSTATVTGYTLSGTIAEGENTVTVTYQGMTTTFTVTGIVESGGDNTEEIAGTLLYSWDFTKGLTDSVSGQTVTLNSATQDSDGLHIATASDYAVFGVDILDRVVEIEFGEVADGGFTTHGRLMTLNNTAEGTDCSRGLIWRSTGKWATYFGSWIDTDNTDKTAMSNKKLKIHFNQPDIYENACFEAYIDGEVLHDSEITTPAYKYLCLGAPSQAFYNATIKTVKVYEEVE